jgi:uncharacterized membrane protein YphA (DoxX/SURF4 family)
MMALDPALAWTLRLSLASLLAAAAWQKLRAPAAFAGAVGAYRLAPSRAAAPLAAALLLGEIVAAGCLLIPSSQSYGAVCAAALLALYAAAIAINLWRGRRDLDCGCGGPGMQRPVSGRLVLRNVLLAGAALLVLLPAADRTLGWIDVFTVLAATGSAGALWTAGARLESNRPALARVRGIA